MNDIHSSTGRGLDQPTARGLDQPTGRVLESSTVRFTIGCRQPLAGPESRVPEFGALVRTSDRHSIIIYGLVCNVTIEDDAFVRQLVAAGVEEQQMIEDQRQRRQVPIIADILIAGFADGRRIRHRIPPRPPAPLDEIYLCEHEEVWQFTQTNDWLRTVLTSMAAPEVPIDQLLGAALRLAAEARPADQRELYLIEAGRDLARLMGHDLTRLDGMLRHLQG